MLSKQSMAQILYGFTLGTMVCISVPGRLQANQDSQLKVAKGVAALEKGDTQKALALFSGAVSDDPEDSDGWFYLGQTRNITRDYAGAVRAFDKVDQTLWPVNFDLGFAYYQLGDYAQVVTAMARVLKDDAGQGAARFYLGVALYRLNRYGKALRYLAKEDRFPKELRPWSLLYVGLSNRKLKKARKAETSFARLQKEYAGSKAAAIAAEVLSGIPENNAAESGGSGAGKKIFSWVTSLGQAWDSNPGLVQDDVAVASQFGAAGLTTTSAALRTQVAMDLGVRLGSDALAWRLGGSLYQSFNEGNPAATDFNVFSSKLATGLEIEQKNWDLDLDVHLVRTLLGLWKGYSSTVGVALNGGVIFDVNRLTVGLEIENQVFDVETPRDGTLLAVPLGYTRVLDGRSAWTAGGRVIPAIYATTDPKSEYAYGGVGVGFFTAIHPVRQFRAAMDVSWDLREYSNDAIYPPGNTLQKRLDNELKLGLLAGFVTGNFFVNGTFNLAHNSSIALYTYTRKVVGVDLGYQF